jgi:hypothetical protein
MNPRSDSTSMNHSVVAELLHGAITCHPNQSHSSFSRLLSSCRMTTRPDLMSLARNALGLKKEPMIWRISGRNSIIKWQGYRVSAPRLAESYFRYTHRVRWGLSQQRSVVPTEILLATNYALAYQRALRIPDLEHVPSKGARAYAGSNCQHRRRLL